MQDLTNAATTKPRPHIKFKRPVQKSKIVVKLTPAMRVARQWLQLGHYVTQTLTGPSAFDCKAAHCRAVRYQWKGTGCSKCPVHNRKRVDRGVAELHDMLVQQFADCTIIGQFPLMSEACQQGRSVVTGRFTKGPDLYVDVVVVFGSGYWLALEICGPEHRCDGTVQERDRKKVEAAAELGLKVVQLHLRADGGADLPTWRTQVLQEHACFESAASRTLK